VPTFFPWWVVVTHWPGPAWRCSRRSRRNPQTILAVDMNGAPLTVEHGAPVRLRVETQLGFKMVKAIKLLADRTDVGMGMGGYREDQQFYSNAAGI
jgi:molybdopterin-dependent oxidoreductase-like protein protein